MMAAEQTKAISQLHMEFTPEEAKEALISLIDSKINRVKVEFWSTWERDHSASREEMEAKIQALEEKKAELLALNKQDRKDVTLKLKGELLMEPVA